MNRERYQHKKDLVIPAALFVVLEGLSAASAMAGDGVVILQREVPVRPAYREGAPGKAIAIDTSPDDKVRQMMSGQQSSLNSVELGDADFASVTTGTPQSVARVVDQVGEFNVLSKHRVSGGDLSASTSGSVQSVTSSMVNTVGAATGRIGSGISSGITGATGALSSLAGAIMRSSGQ